MNRIEKFFEKENFGKLLLRLIIGGFIISNGVIYISDSATALQNFEIIIKLLFGIKIYSKILIIIMALIFITLGTFFLIGFHFRMSTFLLLMVFATKMAYAKFVAQKWIDSEVLYTTAYCAIMLSCLFAGPGTFCADKHK